MESIIQLAWTALDTDFLAKFCSVSRYLEVDVLIVTFLVIKIPLEVFGTYFESVDPHPGIWFALLEAEK